MVELKWADIIDVSAQYVRLYSGEKCLAAEGRRAVCEQINRTASAIN